MDHNKTLKFSILSLGLPMPLFPFNLSIVMSSSSSLILMTCQNNVDCLFLIRVTNYLCKLHIRYLHYALNLPVVL